MATGYLAGAGCMTDLVVSRILRSEPFPIVGCRAGVTMGPRYRNCHDLASG